MSALEERARAPRYTVPEGAAIIGRPVSTVRRWVLGNVRTQGGRTKRDEPLVRADGRRGDPVTLSFLNLLELGFLASYRRHVPLQAIRRALDYAATELEQERPLLYVDFKIYGKSLFLKFAEDMIDASERGQLAWTPAIEGFVKAIDYDDEFRTVYRWWPLGREEPVVIDTRLNGGLPSTAAAGVRTGAIAAQHFEGFAVPLIAEDVGAAVAEVEAALVFERVAA